MCVCVCVCVCVCMCVCVCVCWDGCSWVVVKCVGDHDDGKKEEEAV